MTSSSANLGGVGRLGLLDVGGVAGGGAGGVARGGRRLGRQSGPDLRQQRVLVVEIDDLLRFGGVVGTLVHL